MRKTVHGHKVVAHAGSGDSFPLTGTPQNVRAAWDLAGHSPNPDGVRARVRAFAKAHGLQGSLPADAQHPALRQDTSQHHHYR